MKPKQRNSAFLLIFISKLQGLRHGGNVHASLQVQERLVQFKRIALLDVKNATSAELSTHMSANISKLHTSTAKKVIACITNSYF